MKKKSAFTLIELIVVITILAILGTIAFLSFQGYNSNARDSVRSTDLGIITRSLEVFQVKSGKLPETNSGTNITYSGGLLAWTQGTFSETQRNQTNDINKIPVDPLTQIEYIYSVTNLKNEFELGAAFEGNRTQNKQLLSQTYADSKTNGIARVTGNYNGVLLPIKDPNSDITYIVAVPTIINGNLTWDTIENILANKTLVTNGGQTLPAGYSGTVFDTSKINNNYNPTGNILVFSGVINDLTTDQNKRVLLLKSIQNAYSGTILGQSDPSINSLINISIDTVSPSNEVINLATNLLVQNVGFKQNQINNSHTLTLAEYCQTLDIRSDNYSTWSNCLYDGFSFTHSGKIFSVNADLSPIGTPGHINNFVGAIAFCWYPPVGTWGLESATYQDIHDTCDFWGSIWDRVANQYMCGCRFGINDIDWLYGYAF